MQVNVEKEATYQHILEDGALLGGKFSLCGHVKEKRTKAGDLALLCSPHEKFEC